MHTIDLTRIADNFSTAAFVAENAKESGRCDVEAIERAARELNKLSHIFRDSRTYGGGATLTYRNAKGVDRSVPLTDDTFVSGRGHVYLPDPYDPGRLAVPVSSLKSVETKYPPCVVS